MTIVTCPNILHQNKQIVQLVDNSSTTSKKLHNNFNKSASCTSILQVVQLIGKLHEFTSCTTSLLVARQVCKIAQHVWSNTNQLCDLVNKVLKSLTKRVCKLHNKSYNLIILLEYEHNWNLRIIITGEWLAEITLLARVLPGIYLLFNQSGDTSISF